MRIVLSRVMLIIIILLLMTNATACRQVTEQSEPVQSITTITLARSRDLTGVTNIILQDFVEQNKDIRVNYIETPGTTNDLYNIYTAAFSGGDSNVDVYIIDNIWVPAFASKGYLIPLESIDEKYKRNFLPEAISQCTYNGVLYSMPFLMDMGWLYYRKDLVSSPPKTWKEVQSIGQSLVEQGKVEYGAAIVNGDGEDMLCNVLEYILVNANTAQGLENYKKLLAIAPKSSKGRNSDILRTFKFGKAAFMRNWSFAWQVLNQDDSAVRGKVGVTLIPRDYKGKTGAILGGSSIVLNRFSKNQNEALRLMRYLSSDSVQKDVAVNGGGMPSVKSIYNNERVLEANSHFKLINMDFKGVYERVNSHEYPEISIVVQKCIEDFLDEKISSDAAASEINKALFYLLQK